MRSGRNGRSSASPGTTGSVLLGTGAAAVVFARFGNTDEVSFDSMVFFRFVAIGIARNAPLKALNPQLNGRQEAF